MYHAIFPYQKKRQQGLGKRWIREIARRSDCLLHGKPTSPTSRNIIPQCTLRLALHLISSHGRFAEAADSGPALYLRRSSRTWMRCRALGAVDGSPFVVP